MKSYSKKAGLLWGLVFIALCGVCQAVPVEIADQACLECHGAAAVDQEDPLYVDSQTLVNSAHSAIACAGCHTAISALPHEQQLPAVDCADCHDDQATDYRQSVHGLDISENDVTAQSEPTALCTDCHGTHAVLSMAVLHAPEHRDDVPSLCGRCHSEIAATYRQSIHGKAVASGIVDAPVCTDCHGEHAIASPTDPASSVAPGNIPATCASCHEEERLASQYGLPTHRYTTYLASYHGVVNRYGETAVANCASCHGVHDIRPSSDPQSTIHPDRLAETCGHCHPGLGQQLTGIEIHVEATPESSRGMYYVRTFYTYFIGALMLCFIAYMSIEIYGTLRRRRRP